MDTSLSSEKQPVTQGEEKPHNEGPSISIVRVMQKKCPSDARKNGRKELKR